MNELLLDMDGVMADQMGGVFKELERRGAGSYCHADTVDYWFKEAPFDANLALEIMREPGFFRHLDVITGAVRGINRLRELYDVRVCSAPLKGSQGCETDKREWLAEHFDKDFAELAIVTTDKSKVAGKLIVEDNPYIEVPYGVVMYHQRWNQDAPYPRMYNWGELNVIHEAMK